MTAEPMCDYISDEPGHFACFLPPGHGGNHEGEELGCDAEICAHINLTMALDGVVRGEQRPYCSFISSAPGHFGCLLLPDHPGEHRGLELGCKPELCRHENVQAGDDGIMRGEPGFADERPWRASSIDWPGAVLGLTVAGIGLAVSLATYSSASEVGGTYLVLWGAVLWGAWRLLKSIGIF